MDDPASGLDPSTELESPPWFGQVRPDVDSGTLKRAYLTTVSRTPSLEDPESLSWSVRDRDDIDDKLLLGLSDLISRLELLYLDDSEASVVDLSRTGLVGIDQAREQHWSEPGHCSDYGQAAQMPVCQAWRVCQLSAQRLKLKSRATAFWSRWPTN